MKPAAIATEADFVNALREGDRGLMNRLYRLHFPMVLHLITSNNGSEAEAKDVYQEAYIVLYENLQKPDFELKCKIKTYLYSVSRRLWLKRLDKKKSHTSLHDFEEYLPLVDDDGSLAEARFNLINHAMNKLGEPCRSILEDYYLNDLSMAQIADKMGYTNADNAKTQKYKCFNRLKKILEGLQNEDQ
ncbi:MAG: RNA polymerase sigma factor [Bernardetiaceae bacterium]|jgi:RNA polymerase sigma factor (sigma-70 family)|nr:RNA polymerase sigma factor [Bernardetiaceae bacterium]